MSYVKMKKTEGGYVVICKLCGKRAKRVFAQARSDDPREAASEYLRQHQRAPEHTAAVAAYRSEDAPELSAEERLLREIFGRPEPTERERRRSAARAASAVKRARP